MSKLTFCCKIASNQHSVFSLKLLGIFLIFFYCVITTPMNSINPNVLNFLMVFCKNIGESGWISNFVTTNTSIIAICIAILINMLSVQLITNEYDTSCFKYLTDDIMLTRASKISMPIVIYKLWDRIDKIIKRRLATNIRP